MSKAQQAERKAKIEQDGERMVKLRGDLTRVGDGLGVAFV